MSLGILAIGKVTLQFVGRVDPHFVVFQILLSGEVLGAEVALKRTDLKMDLLVMTIQKGSRFD